VFWKRYKWGDERVGKEKISEVLILDNGSETTTEEIEVKRGQKKVNCEAMSVLADGTNSLLTGQTEERCIIPGSLTQPDEVVFDDNVFSSETISEHGPVEGNWWSSVKRGVYGMTVDTSRENQEWWNDNIAVYIKDEAADIKNRSDFLIGKSYREIRWYLPSEELRLDVLSNCGIYYVFKIGLPNKEKRKVVFKILSKKNPDLMDNLYLLGLQELMQVLDIDSIIELFSMSDLSSLMERKDIEDLAKTEDEREFIIRKIWEKKYEIAFDYSGGEDINDFRGHNLDDLRIQSIEELMKYLGKEARNKVLLSNGFKQFMSRKDLNGLSRVEMQEIWDTAPDHELLLLRREEIKEFISQERMIQALIDSRNPARYDLYLGLSQKEEDEVRIKIAAGNIFDSEYPPPDYEALFEETISNLKKYLPEEEIFRAVTVYGIGERFTKKHESRGIYGDGGYYKWKYMFLHLVDYYELLQSENIDNLQKIYSDEEIINIMAYNTSWNLYVRIKNDVGLHEGLKKKILSKIELEYDYIRMHNELSGISNRFKNPAGQPLDKFAIEVAAIQNKAALILKTFPKNAVIEEDLMNRLVDLATDVNAYNVELLEMLADWMPPGLFEQRVIHRTMAGRYPYIVEQKRELSENNAKRVYRALVSKIGKERADREIREVKGNTRVAVRLPFDVIAKVLKSKRYSTVFDTNSTQGEIVNNEYRERRHKFEIEHRIRASGGLLDQHPVYGGVGIYKNGKLDASGIPVDYGSSFFVLKPEVEKRTLLHSRDSLNAWERDMHRPVELRLGNIKDLSFVYDDVAVVKVASKYNANMQHMLGILETQILGGVELKDIESFNISLEGLSNKIVAEQEQLIQEWRKKYPDIEFNVIY